MRIWRVFDSLLKSTEILKLASQSFCGRLRCASHPGPGNDAIANKVTLNFKKFESAMKAPEDRAAGPGPVHWFMDTAQVHLPHTKFNNSNIDDWSEYLYFRVQGQVIRICCVGVIFQDLGVKHSEVDHKNVGGQVSKSHHFQENCQILSIYASKVERYRIPRLP